MSCSNCFNGCTDIISDQCIKYTGVDVPLLGIENGDSLSLVEQSLVTFLSSALDGTGIIPTIAPEVICSLVQKYLPTCGNITIVNLITALIQSACDLQTQVDTIDATLLALNSDYDTNCLIGIADSADTHVVLQVVIDRLCVLDNQVAIIASDLTSNYVTLANLDALIAAYIASTITATRMSNKMVPWVAMPFYDPDLSGKFDGTGKGLVGTDWEDIYLCNGRNTTPDLRGRVPVGRTDMSGLAFDTAVDPSTSPNPTYADFLPKGSTNIVLLPAQMPIHSHTHTLTADQDAHYHYEFNTLAVVGAVVTSSTYPRVGQQGGFDYTIAGNSGTPTVGRSSSTDPVITITGSIANAGGDGYHMNIQPVLPCYFIIYIP